MGLFLGRLIAFSLTITLLLFFISITSRAVLTRSTWMNSSLQTKHCFVSPSASLLLFEKLALAERLWEQSVADRQRMLDGSGPRDFPDGYIYPYNVWDFARPSYFCPHDLERVGTLGDGGKVVCGMSRYEKVSPGPSADENSAPTLIVYSFGVNDDSSFEARLLERTNAEIWGYDFSVDSWAGDIPSSHLSRAHFKKAGISNQTSENEPAFFTIQDLMAINGHSYIDVVKMDIEGAEFNALRSLTAFINSATHSDSNTMATMPFGQILVEIHLMPDAPSLQIPRDIHEWIGWWEDLEKLGLRPVNNEDNWIGDVGQGKPWFMEVSSSRPFQKTSAFDIPAPVYLD